MTQWKMNVNFQKILDAFCNDDTLTTEKNSQKPKGVRYLLLKDGRMIDLEAHYVSSWNYVDRKTAIDVYGCESAFYEVYYRDGRGEHCERDNQGGDTMDSIYTNEILRKGKNVTKMCDMFINTWENSKPSFWSELDNAISEMKNVEYDIHKNLYGAIWTKQGLIYYFELLKEGWTLYERD